MNHLDPSVNDSDNLTDLFDEEKDSSSEAIEPNEELKEKSSD